MKPSPTELSPTRLDVAPSAFVAPGAILAGRVTLAERSSVWFGTVIRGDLEPVAIGAHSNVQDLTVVHVDRGKPVVVGERVTIGHRCIVHGCVIEDDALIGMGAILLSGSSVGRGAFVAAGAVVREGFVVPAGTVAAGVPAVVRGEVSDELRARIRDGAESYVAAAEAYRTGRVEPEVAT